MGRQILRRLLLVIPVLLAVAFVTFAMICLIPGDIVTNMTGVTAANNEETRARVMAEPGLDTSLLEQYVWWIGRILQGDSGHSFIHRGPVPDEILRTLPITVEMCVLPREKHRRKARRYRAAPLPRPAGSGRTARRRHRLSAIASPAGW